MKMWLSKKTNKSRASWKYELFLFDFFIACNFKQFHFLLLHGSVCVKESHRVNNGKQRTRLPGDLPFIKTSSRTCQIVTLEACYHNDQAEKCKITNAYKSFFLSELACQRHDTLSSNGAVLNSQSTGNFSDVKVQPLQSLLNSVGGVESVFSIFKCEGESVISLFHFFPIYFKYCKVGNYAFNYQIAIAKLAEMPFYGVG